MGAKAVKCGGKGRGLNKMNYTREIQMETYYLANR